MFAMNLALIANNIGLMWVAVELATLTTVLMVGIYRTPEALEAAWKYFILGSVGIALALFGTILVYLAAQPVIGEGLAAMVWTMLVTQRRRVRPRAAATSPSSSCCSATAPRSAWRRCMPGCPTPMPKARRRSRRCCRACCSMSRSMRCCASRCCWPPIRARIAPGPLMIALGLLVAWCSPRFMLYRRRDIKRLFAYSSIEHMGIIAFAFGMGGPLGQFRRAAAHDHAQPDQVGDLLRRRPHRAGQGHAAHRRHRRPDRHAIRCSAGASSPAWSPSPACRRSACSPASSCWCQLHLRARSRCWRCSLVVGLLIAFGALLLRLQDVAFGEPTRQVGPVQASYVPLFAHLALVLIAGIWLPPPLVRWFQHVAALLG